MNVQIRTEASHVCEVETNAIRQLPDVQRRDRAARVTAQKARRGEPMQLVDEPCAQQRGRKPTASFHEDLRETCTCELL